MLFASDSNSQVTNTCRNEQISALTGRRVRGGGGGEGKGGRRGEEGGERKGEREGRERRGREGCVVCT